MTSRTFLVALGVFLAAIAANAGDAGTTGGPGTNRIQLLDRTAPVPAAWVPERPASSMRLAQFRVPGAAGAEGAEFVVFYFGQGQGGSVDANLARWQSQFSSPDGKPVKPAIERFTVGDLPVTVAEFTGSYARSVGMGGGEPAKPDQTLLSAIVETPKGSLWMQLHGPRATVRANREAFLAVVRGIK
jgi:hypothetical protein